MPAPNYAAEQSFEEFWQGDPPSAADEDARLRLELIVDDLERAARHPDAAAYHLSGAFSAFANRGETPIAGPERDRLLWAVICARDAAVPSLPDHVRDRIADGLDALEAYLTRATDGSRQYVTEDDLRDRMRVAQLAAYTHSLIGDIASGRIAGRLGLLTRIVQNEGESLVLLAGLAERHRPVRELAA